MSPRLLRPSQVMKKAYEGLLTYEQHERFKFHRDTFGYFGGSSILGNLSTCAVQAIAGKHFSGHEVNSPGKRACHLGWEITDLWKLESAINAVTYGNAFFLLRYCNLPMQERSSGYHAVPVTAAPEYYKDPAKYRSWILEVIKQLEVIELMIAINGR